MDPKNKLTDDFDFDQIDETDASDTLRPSSRPADTKVGMMAQMVNTMGNMQGQDMIDFFNKMMAQAAEASATIPPGAAQQNQATIAAKGAIKEDLANIFGDNEDLSEDFREKLATLFEAAVEMRVGIIQSELEEAFVEALDEEVQEVHNTLCEQVDGYMNYIAEEWLDSNRVAVEASVKSELNETIVGEIISVLEQYNVDLRDNEINLVDELNQKLDESTTKTNMVMEELIAIKEQNAALEKEFIISEAVNTLSVLDENKFRQLAEGLEYDGDVETFNSKLNTLKEHYDNKPFRKTAVQLNEEEIGYSEDEQKKSKYPHMEAYAKVLSRTAKAR